MGNRPQLTRRQHAFRVGGPTDQRPRSEVTHKDPGAHTGIITHRQAQANNSCSSSPRRAGHRGSAPGVQPAACADNRRTILTAKPPPSLSVRARLWCRGPASCQPCRVRGMDGPARPTAGRGSAAAQLESRLDVLTSSMQAALELIEHRGIARGGGPYQSSRRVVRVSIDAASSQPFLEAPIPRAPTRPT